MAMVAGMVKKGSLLADIGTDHGYIPLYLVQEGIIRSAIAMDINRGPLNRAKDNIAASQLGSLITCRLSNGLEKLGDDEADTIIIAGMGGDLIVSILTSGAHVLKSPKELILQPQSEIYKVRYYLHDIGYRIIEEQMVVDNNKYYTVIKAGVGTEKYEKEYEYYYGAYLLNNKNRLLKEYLLKEAATYDSILAKLNTAPNENYKDRRDEIALHLSRIKGGLVCYDY